MTSSLVLRSQACSLSPDLEQLRHWAGWLLWAREWWLRNHCIPLHPNTKGHLVLPYVVFMLRFPDLTSSGTLHAWADGGGVQNSQRYSGSSDDAFLSQLHTCCVSLSLPPSGPLLSTQRTVIIMVQATALPAFETTDSHQDHQFPLQDLGPRRGTLHAIPTPLFFPVALAEKIYIPDSGTICFQVPHTEMAECFLGRSACVKPTIQSVFLLGTRALKSKLWKVGWPQVKPDVTFVLSRLVQLCFKLSTL